MLGWPRQTAGDFTCMDETRVNSLTSGESGRTIGAMNSRWTAAVVSVVIATASALVSSPAQARTAPLGALAVSDSSIYPGDSVRFTGRLPERVSSRRYVLQVRKNGTWRTVERGYTKRGGRFKVEASLDYPPGRYVFRVFGKPSRLYEVGPSKTRTVALRVDVRPGSMDAPWRPGQRFSMDEWSVAFGATDTDAWPELSTKYNDGPPPAGWAYIAVPMLFTRTGSGSGSAWADLSLGFVGSDGVVYTSFADVNGTEYSCYLSNDWIDAPELYTGASTTATDCMLVRQSAIPGGLWRVSDYGDVEQFVTVS